MNNLTEKQLEDIEEHLLETDKATCRHKDGDWFFLGGQLFEFKGDKYLLKDENDNVNWYKRRTMKETPLPKEFFEKHHAIILQDGGYEKFENNFLSMCLDGIIDKRQLGRVLSTLQEIEEKANETK